MEPPHPYWADHDHDHSDEHLNLIFTCAKLPQAIDPPYPYWADHDHSDEHLNLIHTSVRRQRSLYSSPFHSISSDSGHLRLSESCRSTPRWTHELKVVNTTPSPPATPTSFVEDNTNRLAWKVEERESSEGPWADGQDSETGVIAPSEEKSARTFSHRENSSGFACALRRARECVGRVVVAAGEMIGEAGLGAAGGCGGGGLDGEGEGCVGRGGRQGVCAEGRRGRVWGEVRRMVVCERGVVRLTPATVRFPLD